MGFFTENCPNCGKPVSKQADHCSNCGCPSSGAWTTCPECGTSIGSDSKFCWKCGRAQDLTKRRIFYGARWHRSPGDFALRVILKTPRAVVNEGIEVADGTVALVFQDGVLKGVFESGYFDMDAFAVRLPGFDDKRELHAILLDTRSAEVDFAFKNLRLKKETPIDLNLRLLFQVTDARIFASEIVRDNEAFAVADLAARFRSDVEKIAQAALSGRTLDELFADDAVRNLLEREILGALGPVLEPFGLRPEGLRLNDFGGAAYEELRAKLGEIDQLNRDLEINRQLRDAVREGKVDAYRDETQLRESIDKIAHNSKLSAAAREDEFNRVVTAFEHQSKLEALRNEYELRRNEISNRLEEQKSRHQFELSEAMHAVELHKIQLEADIREQDVRFEAGQHQQVRQSQTDLDVAKSGVEALKLVKQAQFESRKQNDEQDIKMEETRLRLRGDASIQALLATLSGEQAERVLRLAEIEMRRGMTPEQSLALIADKSPEIAPAIAEAMKAHRAQESLKLNRDPK